MFFVRQIFCLAVLAAAQVDARAAEIPVKDFARWRDFESAKISPHGDYLAVSKWIGDQTAVAILELKSMKFTGAMKFSHGQSPANYWWVGPKRVVAEVAIQYGYLDQPYRTGELVALDADGRHQDYLFGFRGDVEVGSRVKRVTMEQAWAAMVDPLVHDPLHALISVWPWNRADGMGRTHPYIDRLNVHNGERKRVDMVPLYWPAVLADDEGQPRFAAGYGKDALCCHLISRESGDSDWKELGSVFASVVLHRVGRKGESVFLSAGDKAEPTCLQEYRFDSDDLVSLHCNGTVDVSDVTFSFDGEQPVTAQYEDGKPQTIYLDPDHPDTRALRSLEKSFPGQRIRVTSRTADGSKAVLLVDSDRNPGDFYLFDHPTRKAAYLMSRRRWIDPVAMLPVEPVLYRTRDGATVHGYLTARGGLQTKNAALVLMPHGGPHGVRDIWEWDPDAQLLASRGYSVLQVNYRGSGGYGDGYEAAGYKKWGTMMQDDLTDGVKWAIAQGIADPNRVCIYGASYGGYAAMMSAVREPELYRCAATLAGVSNLTSQAEDSDVAGSWLGREYLKRVVGDDEADLLTQSPVTHVAKLKAAVLIAHGTRDRRVPFSQAKELRKALERNGKAYEWAEFAGEEHGFFKEENREAFYNKLLAFLDKHIGAAPTATASPAQSTAP